MEREDLETHLLGKDRMMEFISNMAADSLMIDPRIQQNGYRSSMWDNCSDEGCNPLTFQVWSTLLQDIICYGDPLATFRMSALQFRNHNDDEYGRSKDELCCQCKELIARKLENIREHLFKKLPSIFPLNNTDSQD
jgi:hypothetical protein